MDEIYKVMYPADSNVDYTCDEVKNHRRQFVKASDYALRRRVNGDFDLKVLLNTGNAETFERQNKQGII